jgi:hypothetical protein
LHLIPAQFLSTPVQDFLAEGLFNQNQSFHKVGNHPHKEHLFLLEVLELPPVHTVEFEYFCSHFLKVKLLLEGTQLEPRGKVIVLQLETVGALLVGERGSVESKYLTLPTAIVPASSQHSGVLLEQLRLLVLNKPEDGQRQGLAVIQKVLLHLLPRLLDAPALLALQQLVNGRQPASVEQSIAFECVLLPLKSDELVVFLGQFDFGLNWAHPSRVPVVSPTKTTLWPGRREGLDFKARRDQGLLLTKFRLHHPLID